MLKIIFYGFLGLCAIGVVGVVVFITMFSSMIFVGPISDAKLLALKRTQVLVDGVLIEEVMEHRWTMDTWRDQYYAQIRPYDEGVVRVDDTGAIWPESAFHEGMPLTSALVLASSEGKAPLLMLENSIYSLTLAEPLDIATQELQPIGQREALLGEYEHKVRYVSFAEHLNKEWVLAAVYRADTEYTQIELLQINLLDFSFKRLSENPTFINDFPPIVVPINGGAAQLLIYFEDSLSWGFGGLVNRPKYQTIRLFNAEHPAGLDIAKISLRDGVIFRVWDDGDTLYFLTDPNTPKAKTQAPSRLWRLSLGGL